MNHEARFAALVAIVAAKMAEIKATQEIILKAQATFVAQVSQQPWQPIFDDLRNQAKEAAEVYREQVLREFDVLRNSRGGVGGSPPGGSTIQE